jgi:5-methylcytosine-specific restriction endonuclease McrA
MADAIISCAAAFAQGLKRYYTGEPCIHGHLAERLVLNGQCVACYNERRALYMRSRRASSLQAQGHHTIDDIWRIYNAQKGKCAVCRKNVGTKFDVDHIQPLSAGGNNSPMNLQILCPRCNRLKGRQDPFVFMRSQGFLL